MTSDAEELPAPEPAAAVDVKPRKPHRARRIISMILVVLVGVLVPLSVTTVWSTRTVLDTDRFTALVSDVTSDPAVLNALSTRLTDEALTAVASSDVVQNLPPPLPRAAAVILGAMRGRVQEAVDKVLASSAFQDALKGTVAIAHRQAIKLLEGKGLLNSDAFTIKDGTVTLNLWPLVQQVLVKLQSDGVLPSSWQIPSADQPPSALQSTIGGKLPENFGQIVVYQTNDASKERTLDAAQRGLALGRRGVVLLVVLTLVLAVVAVLVAVDRRRAVFRIGLAITIGTLVEIVALRRVINRLPTVATTPGGKAVAAALGDAFGSSVIRILALVAAGALVMALVARFWWGLARWSASHPELGALVVVSFGIVVLLVLGTGWGALITALIIVALGLFGVWYAAKHLAPPAEDSDEPSEPSEPTLPSPA